MMVDMAVAEEKEDAVHIYFTAGSNDIDCSWYVIKKDTKPNEYLSPVFLNLHPNYVFSFKSTCVALGSFLYVIGGYHTVPTQNYNKDGDSIIVNALGTNEVHCIDTLNPVNGWTKCPPMSVKRIKPQAFTLDGKIYVIGGFTLPSPFSGWIPNGSYFPWIVGNTDEGSDIPPSPSHDNNYIEVFDPYEKEAKWRPSFCGIPDDCLREHLTDAHLIRPRPRPRPSGGGELDLFVRMVGGHTTKRLFKYDSDHQSWDLYADDFGPYRCQTHVFVDDILYCYNSLQSPVSDRFREAFMLAKGSILCFNVNKPEAEPKKLMGLEDLLPDPNYLGFYPTINLLHLSGGTKFCLLWEEHDRFKGSNGGDGDAIRITCLKFRVYKRPSGGEGEFDLVATHQSMSSYYVDARCLINSIAM